MNTIISHNEVLDFWFNELTPKQWWVRDSKVDAEMIKRFSSAHLAAAEGQLQQWRETPEGRLAEVIVLDQFSRNIYRNSAEAYAFDEMALALAQEAVRVNADKKLPVTQRAFLYLPYMHSESLDIHEEAVVLFSQPGLEYNLEFEYKHKVIIERFSRYPHRNEVLGRTSTPEEIEFLKEPDSSF